MAKQIKVDAGDLDARLTAAEEKVKALHDVKNGEITGLNTLIQQTTDHINELAADVGAIDSISPSDPAALSQMMDERLQAQREMNDAKAKLDEAQKMLTDCQKNKEYLTSSEFIGFSSDMGKLYGDYIEAYKTALQPLIDTLADAAVQTERIRLYINDLIKSAGKLCKGQTGFPGASNQVDRFRIKNWLKLLEDFGYKDGDIYRQAQED